MNVLPKTGNTWLGNDKKTFAVWNGGNENAGQVWAKGKMIKTHKHYKFDQGDEIVLSYTACPKGELSIVKNGKSIGKTYFKIRGEDKFRFCASLTKPGDIIYRSLWGLLDERLHG